MTGKPSFYPLRWIKNEWGVAMAIETIPYPSAPEAMERSYRLSESKEDFKNNYTVAVLDEDGNYVPIPKGASDELKKGFQ